MNEKVEETIEKISETVEDMKEFAEEKTKESDVNSKEKVNELVKKAEELINEAKNKVIEAANNIKDDEKLNSLLNTVVIKAQEAADFTKMKISEALPEKEKIESIEKDIVDSFDRFTETETVQTVVKAFQRLSEQVTEYLERPEVKKKINKAKKATLNAAEKGMEKLRDVLEVEEEEDVDASIVDNQENENTNEEE